VLFPPSFPEDHYMSLFMASERSIFLWSSGVRIGPCDLVWPMECEQR
jgi:hypothetical protein